MWQSLFDDGGLLMVNVQSLAYSFEYTERNDTHPTSSRNVNFVETRQFLTAEQIMANNIPVFKSMNITEPLLAN